MAAKVKSKSKDKQVLDLAEKLLTLIGINAKVDLQESEGGFTVNIDAGEESGLLIGNRGRTLQSLQLILSLMVNKGKEDWIRISVDVASWREKEEERLVSLAKQTAERARTSGQPQNLYNLTPSQRRTIHLALSTEENIKTESYGEGKERYLVITSTNK